MYQIPELLKFPGLKHTISTVDDGNMASWILGVEKDKDMVLKNRKKILDKAQIDINTCVCMRVVHGSDVCVAHPKSKGMSMKNYDETVPCDGMITDKKGLFLFLLIADCLPIILFDSKKSALGLVHAGWRGTEAQIAKKAVAKMKKEFSSNTDDLVAGFGPAARVPQYFKDFVGDCRKQLIEAGVLEKNIFDSNVNTMIDKRFFSHRRDLDEGRVDAGRFACVVGMK